MNNRLLSETHHIVYTVSTSKSTHLYLLITYYIHIIIYMWCFMPVTPSLVTIPIIIRYKLHFYGKFHEMYPLRKNKI